MKEYIKRVHGQYNFWKIFEMSIIISVLIVAIDIFNLITNIVNSSSWTLFVILLIGSITIILLETYVFLRLAYINTIDYILSMLFIAEGLVLIEEYMINRLGGYRKTVLFIVFLITVFFLCYRGIKYGKNIKEYEKRKKDIWNLKQLYEYDNQNEDNNIPVGRICISEKEADYDLLNREYIIEQIYDTIVKNEEFRDKLVLGIEGKWGSGKSTIINNVKRKLKENKITEKFIIIDQFDIWQYENNEEILVGMLTELLKVAENKKMDMFFVKNIKRIMDALTSLDKKTNIVRVFLEQKEDIENVKLQIQDYLKVNNKKIIFIIDDFDRIESEKIAFVFKLITKVLAFENVIYILSYDIEQIKKVFKNELGFDENYYKKVIQIQIKIPEISKEVKMQVWKKCIKNLFAIYDFNYEQECRNLIDLIDDIMELLNDTRDLIRICNSVIIPVLCMDYVLICKYDLLVLEIVKFLNWDLYKTIYQQKEYFVEKTDLESFKNERNEKYEEIFKKREEKKFLKLLSAIFPNINRFQDESTMIHGNPLSKEDKENQVYVYNDIVFENYFALDENKYREPMKELKNYIAELNNKQDNSGKIENNIISIIQEKRLPLIILEPALQTIHVDKYNSFIQQVFSYINNQNTLQECNKIISICIKMLDNMEPEEFKQTMNEIKERKYGVKLISTMNEIRKGIKNNYYKDKWDEYTGNLVIDNRSSNIYKDENYMEKTIYALIEIDKDLTKSVKKIKEYINCILNKYTVIYFIYDMLKIQRNGNNVVYFLDSQIYQLVEKDKINELINGQDYPGERGKIKKIYQTLLDDDYCMEEEIDFEKLLEEMRVRNDEGPSY